MNYRSLTTAAAALIAGISANAGIIVATNFDTADKTGADTMTGVVWTGDDLVNVTPSTSMSYVVPPPPDSDNGNPNGFHENGYGATAFAPAMNVQNTGDWVATITFDLLNGYTGTLTELSFNYQGLTNGGANQGGGKAVPFNVTINGNTFDTTKTASNTSGAGSLSFTDSEALVGGTNTIVISTDFYTNGGGWNIGIDDLVLTGDISVGGPSDPVKIIDSGFNGADFEVVAINLDPATEYVLTRSENLADRFLTVVDGPRLPLADGTPGTDTFTDDSAAGTKGFYRVEEAPAPE